MARSHRLPPDRPPYNPSKFIPEERIIRNWWKHDKKHLNTEEMKPERMALFKQLLEIGERGIST